MEQKGNIKEATPETIGKRIVKNNTDNSKTLRFSKHENMMPKKPSSDHIIYVSAKIRKKADIPTKKKRS